MALEALVFGENRPHASVIGLAGAGDHALPLVMVWIVIEPMQHGLLEIVGLVDGVHWVRGRAPVFEFRETFADAGHHFSSHE